MSAIRIRTDSGWVDPCVVPTKIRDANGNWILLQNKAQFFNGSDFTHMICTADIELTAISNKKPNSLNTVAGQYTFFVNGKLSSNTKLSDALTQTTNINAGLTVEVSAAPDFVLRVNGVKKTENPYSFIPTADTTLLFTENP